MMKGSGMAGGDRGALQTCLMSLEVGRVMVVVVVAVVM